MHLFVFSGPDYSEETVRRTNPEVWARAESAPCARATTHGYAIRGALMSALNKSSGKLYFEALDMVRVAREGLHGPRRRYPHSESIIIPGGVALFPDRGEARRLPAKARPLRRFCQEVHSGLGGRLRFLYEANPEYAAVGEAPATMVDFGLWDDEEAYDASYERWANGANAGG